MLRYLPLYIKYNNSRCSWGSFSPPPSPPIHGRGVALEDIPPLRRER
ncbi:hypothetical protein BACCAP_04326 [Pseudoflavonifractor capillosus ATCC 29799]|uniref:Uncharacterized protein n=1 Tax=Pseudoflavonifractor capillosus ATCC 29799 TaxID=411467 RepID=A6P1F8_9FIRM|nr:hypothetical protein BACCAP_04326 [Pseudoflavonifractor capillosus ATCC 29799]